MTLRKKRRMPLEQLKEAGRIARQMLKDRGIEGHEILKAIMEDPKSPMLPGLPPYLPPKWTLRASQRMCYDLLLMWRSHCEEEEKDEQNITEFWKFIIKELKRIQKVHEKEIRKTPQLLKSLQEVPVLRDIFAPVRNRSTTLAMHHFFPEAFAVAVILERHHETGEFAEWFLDWTEELYKLWLRPDMHALDGGAPPKK